METEEDLFADSGSVYLPSTERSINMETDEDLFADSGSLYLPPTQRNSSENSLNQCSDRLEDNTISSIISNDIAQYRLDLTGPNQKSRKRQKQPDTWKRNVKKRKRNSGQQYENYLGVVVPEKEFANQICNCKKQCPSKLSFSQQKTIHHDYYALSNFDLQTAFIFGSIKIISKMRKYTNRDISRRNFTRIYSLKDLNGKDVSVCKKFFKGVLQVSDGRINRALSRVQLDSGAVAPKDKRGKKSPPNKTSSEKIDQILEFLKKIPSYQSHYSRHHNLNRKYLSPELNLTKLYELYKSETENFVSKFIFTETFNKRTNLHFHAPLSDTCKICDNLENKLRAASEREKTILAAEKDVHLIKADLVKKNMKLDAEKSKMEENDVTVICFDLMRTLPTPVITTGISYYKRKLWTYCLGIHNLGNKRVHMYVWDESVASRGPDEIASCLLHYIENNVRTTNLIMYSDQCGGQNRNIKMALFCLKLVLSDKYRVKDIEHKFFISGHSYMPCDQDFGLVEKNKKYFPHIFDPAGWLEVIKTSSKKIPFDIVNMTSVDFFSSELMLKSITNRKKDENKAQVNWLKICCLKYKSTQSLKIFFKYSSKNQDIFSVVNIKKRLVSNLDISEILLYPNGRKIASEKKKDLLDLLNFIPPVHHFFYNCLETEHDVDEMIFSESEDD